MMYHLLNSEQGTSQEPISMTSAKSNGTHPLNQRKKSQRFSFHLANFQAYQMQCCGTIKRMIIVAPYVVYQPIWSLSRKLFHWG